MSKSASLRSFTTKLLKGVSTNVRSFNVKAPKLSVDASKKRIFKNVIKTSDYLILEKNEKETYKYPLVWLRDNCQCSNCFHENSRSRTIDWEKFSDDQELIGVERDDESEKLVMIWADGHKSSFEDQWLLDRNFTKENQDRYLSRHYRPPKLPLWGKNDFNQILKRFEYEEVINTDEGLFKWLDTLSRVGVVMLEGTPLNRNECRKLADRVGFIRKTHYGEEFEVIAKEGTSNVAYLSSALQLHTDLPYYDYKPGVNLLHCLVQSRSEGGYNQLADGFYVAQQMKQKYPVYFKTLSETLVNWSDIGQENANKFHSIFRAPVIMLDHKRQFSRINHSVPQRDSFFTIPVEEVQVWYKAMQKFVEIMHQETVMFKTQPGEILTFDNIRLIHGRTGYTDKTSNTRHLIGSYLDWDEIYSRLRVLKKN